MAVKCLTGLDLAAQLISNLKDPVSNQDAATKKYVDTVRATFSNANYGAGVSDRYIATGTTAFTSSHTVLLMAANAVLPGTLIYIGDDGGAITAAFTLSISRAGSDTIMKQTSSLVLDSVFSSVILESDGVSNWHVVARFPAIKQRTITSGTTFTPSIGVKALYVECVGGGGAGGGCASPGSGNVSIGGGGGGGGYAAVWVLVPKSSYTIAVGAGGTGVSGAAGNAGGATTFDSPSICTAGGGNGGSFTAATTTLQPTPGAAAGSGTTGTLLLTGQDGGNALIIGVGSAQAVSGAGGGSELGGGSGGARSGLNTNAAGAAGHNYGGGGAGSTANGTGAALAGGAGAPGVINVTEFF